MIESNKNCLDKSYILGEYDQTYLNDCDVHCIADANCIGFTFTTK